MHKKPTHHKDFLLNELNFPKILGDIIVGDLLKMGEKKVKVTKCCSRYGRWAFLCMVKIMDLLD